MKPPDDPEVGAWVAKAESDLRMARLAVADDDPMWDQCCFHAQQAAEKALKALLVACHPDVPRTHDLVRLVELLAGDAPELPGLEAAAATLTHYGVASRYPGAPAA
jgi:HEPN domain-containing protein